MAVTIVRTPWIDDDGSGTTGTVLNNAIKTELYGQIDGALAQLAPGSNGLLNITTFGTNQIVAGGTGSQKLYVQNTAAGATNFARIAVGNDAGPVVGIFDAYATTYASATVDKADGVILGGLGAGGLSLWANHGSGAIRFYTGGTTERMQVVADGRVLINTTSTAATAQVAIASNQNTTWGLAIKSLVDVPSGWFSVFLNAAGVVQGNIAAVNSTTVAYVTTSDQRLKEDLGIAEDLTALRAVVVHDFVWSAHGGHDRGVFAQETFPVFPRAISVGSPGDDLSKPWMTDYSKFVPDLIVGWQEHDRRLARLESLVNERR